MATFLLKTEPGEFSWDDLVRAGESRWDGVSNPTALAALRRVQRGDEAWIYHTGSEKSIVGLARVARGAYEDPQQPGLNDAGAIRRPVIDLKAWREVPRRLTLADIKSDPRFKDFALVRQGRLSVMEVPPTLDQALRALCGLS